MSSTRQIKSPGVFAADANTVIPPTPIQGVAYRAPVTEAETETGWEYFSSVNSAEFNQMMLQYSTLISIMDKKGVLGWSDQVDYTEASIAFGSDGNLYTWLLASGPNNGGSKDPISNPTYWKVQFVTSASGYMMVRDEKSTGTSGGNTTGSVQTRTLNTVSTNTISGASVGSNQITLPAGTYRIASTTPFFNCDQAKAYLYNVTDSVNTIVGTNADNTVGIQTIAIVNGQFTIASTKVFELRCIASAITDGLGIFANRAGLVEVYSQVEITKVA